MAEKVDVNIEDATLVFMYTPEWTWVGIGHNGIVGLHVGGIRGFFF